MKVYRDMKGCYIRLNDTKHSPSLESSGFKEGTEFDVVFLEGQICLKLRSAKPG